jgi:hypothetical protein
VRPKEEVPRTYAQSVGSSPQQSQTVAAPRGPSKTASPGPSAARSTPQPKPRGGDTSGSRTRREPPKPDLSKRCPVRLGCTIEELRSLREAEPDEYLAGCGILELSQSAWCRIRPSSVKTDLREGRLSWTTFAEGYLDRLTWADQEETSSSEEEAEPVEEGRSKTEPSSPEESTPQADH